MLKARDLGRVYGSILLIFFGILGCGMMVIKGRKDAAEGDTLQKRGDRWIENLRKEAKEEKQTAPSS
jgi:hypothetical protein